VLKNRFNTQEVTSPLILRRVTNILSGMKKVDCVVITFQYLRL